MSVDAAQLQLDLGRAVGEAGDDRALGAVVSRSVRTVTGALAADGVPAALNARTVNV